ncbi:hypothetical protein GCM10012288_20650 [Malaciobacter pacificus]|jgi:hypothetical protein|uniref:Uncharacterized protein n=1 Tax=Malaciobacter pacificus TaxID=1080223 RepID=A0A5C2HDM9_9BACT|nr:hypothetical protein [Malaciobacter pacificus]QEP35625.1 hypothetical protein APAC_2583 [Malaciobacter pacificus]GGD46243.1 hypothetical protein GCM10012288_20650 [Malaciobacter pacificus]
MNTNDLMNTALKLANLEEMPYDTNIIVEGENIKKVLIGIDMETPELLLAKELGYDCVVSHHPKADSCVVDFAKVMDVQIDRMVASGVPINKAQKALRKRQASVDLGGHASNYDRVSSAARLMNMPYLNIHIPADFITEKIVQTRLNKAFNNKPKTKLKDIIEELNSWEYYIGKVAQPVIRVGSSEDYAGKIEVLMAGGTNGGVDVYKSYFEAGVGTIIAMHVPEDVKKAVQEQNIGNIIIAPHMPSDSIGLLEIVKAWREKGVEVTCMSGIVE